MDLEQNFFCLLGSGTSTGVPLIGCTCAVCHSSDPRNDRLRASAWIWNEGRSVLIDTSPDFRRQALRASIPRVDAVLYSHPHADHAHGIDDLRSFNYLQKTGIPLHGNASTIQILQRRFDYIFQEGRAPGGGKPMLEPHVFDAQSPHLEIAGLKIIPLSLRHGTIECVGYRIGSLSYVPDCHEIPEATLERICGSQTLVIDCVRITPHPTHLHLARALDYIAAVRPTQAYLTHLGHEFDAQLEGDLPPGVRFAYDGLVLPIGSMATPN